jgi:hypothetical protein
MLDKKNADRKISFTKQKSYIPGYNYITDYHNLDLCEEGETYDNSTKTCHCNI